MILNVRRQRCYLLLVKRSFDDKRWTESVGRFRFFGSHQSSHIPTADRRITATRHACVTILKADRLWSQSNRVGILPREGEHRRSDRYEDRRWRECCRVVSHTVAIRVLYVRDHERRAAMTGWRSVPIDNVLEVVVRIDTSSRIEMTEWIDAVAYRQDSTCRWWTPLTCNWTYGA